MAEDLPNEPAGRFYSAEAMSHDEAQAECERLMARERFIEHIPRETKPRVWKVSSRLRPDWRRFSTSDRLDKPVRQGERFVARTDIEVSVMTHWQAPFTGGNNATLPAGTAVVAQYDQQPNVPGFSAVPEDYGLLEAVLVPQKVRDADKYGRYSLSFVLDDIGIKIEPLT